MKTIKSQRTICLAFALLSMAVTGSTVHAEESVVNPAGTWKVTVLGTNTSARPAAQTLKLKLEGGMLTGTLSYNSGPVINGKAPTSELPISQAKLQGNEISFNFSHPPAVGNGPNADYTYQGKVSGDTIKGTFVVEWMGHTRTKNWEARRLKK
jgi:hypothetical protein